MSFHLGFPHAHQRSSEQQHEIREARRQLRERIRTDWSYPALPQFQLPASQVERQGDGSGEERIAGFKFHNVATQHDRNALLDRAPQDLGFEPVEWRERTYSSQSSSESESLATASSDGSKKSIYTFEGPDSVGTQLSDRKLARKRKRQRLLDEEVTWNDGLAHWIARRDAWCGAHGSSQVQNVTSTAEEPQTSSGSASANSTPRTSTSSLPAPVSEATTSPSTTPELPVPSSEPALIPTQPPSPPSEVLVPLAPTILPNHPIRRRITAEIYPEIYAKIILQSRTPSVPINLFVLIRALVQGWKDDGEWPPKQAPPEKAIGRRKKSGGGETLKNGVKAMGRVLRITSGESSVGSNHREKG